MQTELRILTTNEYQTAIRQFDCYHYSQSAEHDYHATTYGNSIRYGFFLNGNPVILYRTARVKFLKKKTFQLGSFGPIINTKKVTQEVFDIFIKALRHELKRSDDVFLQSYPVLLNEEENEKVKRLVKNNPVLKKSKHKFTWLDGTMYMDLTQSLGEITHNFRKDLKYNIKRAQRNELPQLHIANGEEETENFFELYRHLQKKKSFTDTAIPFYRELIADKKAQVFIAYAGEEPVSGILVVTFDSQSTAITYLSASTPNGLKLHAPSILRWEVIKWCKEQGYKRLDFFSIDKKHPSITKFKEAFRPKKIFYLDYAYDIVADNFSYTLYQCYNIGTKLKQSFLRRSWVKK